MKIQEILFSKARAQELSHFYIVESAAPFREAQDELLNFCHDFIRDYYQKIEGHKQSLENLQDHPDVLVLGLHDDEDKKEAAFYSVSEAEALSKFFEWKPVQSQRKFAVILNAHRINTTVANKWLKLLEEPPQTCTIFLLNPKSTKLLDTIHSRALHLRLPYKKTDVVGDEWPTFLNDVKTLSLSSFLDQYLKGDLPLSFWVEELLRSEAQELTTLSSKESLQKWLKDYAEMEVFHQSAATKWTLFYHYLKEHVLTRPSR